MAGNALQQMAWRYLVRLGELSEGGLKPEVDAFKFHAELGFSSDESRAITSYLESKDLISWKCRVPCVRITTRGIEMVQNSYEQQEIKVLQKIYDLSQQNTAKPVFVHQLESELGMGWQEVTGFCKGLNEAGFIDWPPDVEAYLFITRAGIDAINSLGKPKPHTGGDIYNTTIGTVQGGAHIGPGGTQNIKFNYQPISEIIPQLTQLIEAVRKEDFDTKDDVIHDLEIAHQVAWANPEAIATDTAWKRVLTKLTAARTTMELAGFVFETYPYWPQIWDFINQHVK